MGKKRMKQPPPPRWSWRAAVLGALALLAVSGGAFWSLSKPPQATAGPPSLVVDRTDVDLGYRAFGSMAEVAFALTNAGSGPLKLDGVPQVQALEGC